MSREAVEEIRRAAERVENPETRQAMLAHCDWQERVDEAAERLPDPPACPRWCTLSTGHRYDSVSQEEPFVFSRFHEWTVGDGTYIAQEEEIDQYGIVTVGQPFARLMDSDEKLTADGLRKQAALALNLADNLDEIVAATR